MRRRAATAVLALGLACGPSAPPSGADGSGSGAATRGSTTQTSSATGADAADETGAPTTPHELVYLRSTGELRVIGTDGSDDRLLGELEDWTTRSHILGVIDGVAFGFGELADFGVGRMVYGNLDGSGGGVEDALGGGPIWLAPSGMVLWYPGTTQLMRRPLGGASELVATGGRPWSMSRTRRHVAASSFAAAQLRDLGGAHGALEVDAAELPTDDPMCSQRVYPGFWLDADEERVFVYPTPELNVALVPLADPTSGLTIDVGPAFEPLGYDLCEPGLLGRRPDGSIVRLAHDGGLAEIAPAVGPLVDSDVGFSRDGTTAVTTSTDGTTRRVHVADLFSGSWTTVALPDGPGTLEVGMVGAEHAVIWAWAADGTSTAFRIGLASGELDALPTCDGLAPAVTDDGEVIVCGPGTDGVDMGVTAPGEPIAPLASSVVDRWLLPLDPDTSPCVDTEPELLVLNDCV